MMEFDGTSIVVGIVMWLLVLVVIWKMSLMPWDNSWRLGVSIVMLPVCVVVTAWKLGD